MQREIKCFFVEVDCEYRTHNIWFHSFNPLSASKTSTFSLSWTLYLWRLFMWVWKYKLHPYFSYQNNFNFFNFQVKGKCSNVFVENPQKLKKNILKNLFYRQTWLERRSERTNLLIILSYVRYTFTGNISFFKLVLHRTISSYQLMSKIYIIQQLYLKCSCCKAWSISCCCCPR